MAGTRTAPAVTGAATGILVTIHLIDSSGDRWTEALRTTIALATTANIEAVVAAYQAVSQASCWKVTTETSWEGAALVANAENNARASGADGVNMLFRDISLQTTQTSRLVSPVAAALEGDNDIPNLVNIATLTSAIDALLPANYTFASAQYTERRERKNNPRITA